VNWIKVSVSISRDTSVDALADDCGIVTPLAVGHWVMVLTAMAEGVLDGDLSGVLDTTLEKWAMWKGRKGRFAAAVRAHLCTPEGIVRSWAKYNGSKLNELASDAERKRAERERRRQERLRTSAGHPPDSPADIPRTSDPRPPLRDETRRDVREQQQQVTTGNAAVAVVPAVVPARARPPRSVAAFAGFSKPLCDAVYAKWLEKAGAVDYARLRKAFGPILAQPEAERPPGLPRDAEVVPAVAQYLACALGTSEARFRTPERCAERLGTIVHEMRLHPDDAEARLRGCLWSLGITELRSAGAA